MNELNITVDRSAFSLLWMSLHSRENELLKRVEVYGEDSDEGADALNDLAYLRLYKNNLEEKAKAVFDANAFIVSDEPYNPSTLDLVK